MSKDGKKVPKSTHVAMVDIQQERNLLSLENQELSFGLQDSDRLKQELHGTKEATKKLTRQRDRLKRLLEQQHQQTSPLQSEIQGNLEDAASDIQSSVSFDWDTSLSSTTASIDNTPNDKEPETTAEALVPGPGANRRDVERGPGGRGGEMGENSALRTQLGALQLENISLVKEKRKGDEQRDNLVQELAALNNKCEFLQEKCNRLESENQRLCQAFSARQNGNQSPSLDEVENIELMKAQVRLYEEDCKAQAALTQRAELENKRLRAELNEARAVIRELRMALPPRDLQMYQQSEFQPVFQQVGYIPRAPVGYAGRRPLAYYGHDVMDEPGMTRTFSGGYIGPQRHDDLVRRGVRPTRKAFLSPDMTAVVDGREGSVSFKSI